VQVRMDNHVFDRHVTLRGDRDAARGPGAATSGSSSSNSNNNGNSSTRSSGSGSSSGSGGGKGAPTAPGGGGVDSNDVGMFEAIVTDPPYGIRAGAKKSGKRKQGAPTYPLPRPLPSLLSSPLSRPCANANKVPLLTAVIAMASRGRHHWRAPPDVQVSFPNYLRFRVPCPVSPVPCP
jgi:hypothetical protein